MGDDGYPANFNWTIPTPNDMCGSNECTCVLRIRYNISTSDYPWELNSTFNGYVNSPITQNPVVDIGAGQGFRLAINTAQLGRTFQDRSHTFKVTNPPNGVGNGKIYNFNVRGKRGNIVQTYPSVEYDFVPNRLYVKRNDWLHIQWTGSNTHNNGPNGGDGQTGDDGQGEGGTDRSNLIQILSLNSNYPLPKDQITFFPKENEDYIPGRSFDDAVLSFATAGAGVGVNVELNDAPAYYDGGLVKMTTKGEFYVMSSRNNDFSNRSHKATIIVE